MEEELDKMGDRKEYSKMPLRHPVPDTGISKSAAAQVNKQLILGRTERKFWNYSWWCFTHRPQPIPITHRIQAFSVPLQCTYIAFTLSQGNYKIVLRLLVMRDCHWPAVRNWQKCVNTGRTFHLTTHKTLDSGQLFTTAICHQSASKKVLAVLIH